MGKRCPLVFHSGWRCSNPNDSCRKPTVFHQWGDVANIAVINEVSGCRGSSCHLIRITHFCSIRQYRTGSGRSLFSLRLQLSFGDLACRMSLSTMISRWNELADSIEFILLGWVNSTLVSYDLLPPPGCPIGIIVGIHLVTPS